MIYNKYAYWWPLLSAPEEYAEEAAFFQKALLDASKSKGNTLLELGSGGGNNASYLKHYFKMTLVDLSPEMLEVSKKLNPECEHIQGDMRKVRLDRTFDFVFIHDAICYMTNKDDLGRALGTAFIHCRPGGVALFVPDFFKENFKPYTSHGGHDGDEKSLRYLEWVWDPDPDDETYVTDFAFLFKDRAGDIKVEHERHIEGLFSRDEWKKLLLNAGFEPDFLPFEHSELESGQHQVIVCRKPS